MRELEDAIRFEHEIGSLDYTRANGAARFISRAPIRPAMHARNAGSGEFCLAARNVPGDTIDAIYRSLIAYFEKPRGGVREIACATCGYGTDQGECPFGHIN
jgi:hypothetical protein